MTQEKFKRISIAATVCSVVLACFLVMFLAFQVITIVAKNNRLKAYDAEKAELTRLIEESSDKLDMYKQDWKIQARARELGYRFPGDVNIDD